MKFQAGDHVRVISNLSAPRHYAEIGSTGIVDYKNGDASYIVSKLRNSEGEMIRQHIHKDDLELVSKKGGCMATISPVAQTVLDKDSQALVEAGYLSESLNLTEKATEFMEAQLFAEIREKMVAQAKKELRDRKKTA